MIRVYCIDDHEIVLRGLSADLVTHKGISVVGTSTDPREALRTLVDSPDSVDVVVTDIEMPEVSGFDVCAQLRKKGPLPRVMYLTYHMTDVTRAKARYTEANAIVYKSASTEEIVSVIRRVFEGESLIERVIEDHEVPISVNTTLSRSELEVLRLIACEFLTGAEIAERLNRSRQTVESHRKNIMQKLGTRNISELVHFAITMGVCSPK